MSARRFLPETARQVFILALSLAGLTINVYAIILARRLPTPPVVALCLCGGLWLALVGNAIVGIVGSRRG